MASLLDIERDFGSPLQLDCAAEGKAVPAQRMYIFKKMSSQFWELCLCGNLNSLPQCPGTQVCARLSAGSEEIPHKDIESLSSYLPKD